MSAAKNTAGVLGKFGSTSFTSVSSALRPTDPKLPPRYPKTSKFFKSRNLKDNENVIEEEEEAEESAGLVVGSEESVDGSSCANDANDPDTTGTDTVLPSNEDERTGDVSSLGLDSTLSNSTSSLNSTVLAKCSFTPLPSTSKDSHINVAVRARPLLPKELKKTPPETSVLDITEDQVIVALKKTFRFDTNFDENISQEHIYTTFIGPLVSKVLLEYNASIFAYGQTGTGKTYTMGVNDKTDDIDHPDRGIIPRAIKQIFQENTDLTVKVSFYEIFNEQVYDLINPSKQRVPLTVREFTNQGQFKIVQLTEVMVKDMTDALALLEQGSSLRSTESNKLNLESSRSHAVFTLTITSQGRDGGLVTRKLNLVDLAGSESSRKTKATGERFSEGVNINKGLLSLGNVIRALADKKGYVPYRDSVLTKVLKEGLQTTSYIAMIACISPTGTDMHETINTLRFANKAKDLVTRPIPAMLAESNGLSAAKKRKFGELIPQTPGFGWNHTIHTPTPSKMARRQETKRALNLTIGTPGKRAKGEGTFITPHSRYKSTLTSTLVKKHPEPASPDSPTFSNLSGVSMIQGPDEKLEPSEDDTKIEQKTFSIQDISAVVSPYMRKLTEAMTEQLRKIHSEYQTKSKLETPRRKTRPRMTSSPVFSASKPSVDQKRYRETVADTQTLSSESEVRQAESPSETIISGTVSCLPLSDVTNKRLQAVMQSASPDFGKASKSPSRRSMTAAAATCSPPIPVYESPASTAPASRKPASPTIEEMERALGINPESPGIRFLGPPDRAAEDRKMPRASRARSSRRTTMGGNELEKSLLFIRESANRRRSGRPMRAAAQNIFYGSPSRKNLGLDENQVENTLNHPLLNQYKYNINPERQREHNQSILTLLNTGSLKLLTALPSIGPKTGLILHTYREINNGIKSIQELETINGLGPKFYKKFLTQNQIVLDE